MRSIYDYVEKKTKIPTITENDKNNKRYATLKLEPTTPTTMNDNRHTDNQQKTANS